MSQSVGLFRRAFHEVPHLVVGGGFFLTTLVGWYFASKRYNKYNLGNTAWKRRYVVVREENFKPEKQIHRPDVKHPWF
ncbi:hypothetical protein CDAR_171191 [Caerostris darwini]|uniref:NADH dehydrogenase [ubiquinone] 1 alpha subcomplex subunit 1 n=1 Tax=Caerostris darwini TaxID=1538125 RepID=A0AAV4WMY3_9ARAC|nr:hypothetical protein CDAR_171191 [Caerostris darwini]